MILPLLALTLLLDADLPPGKASVPETSIVNATVSQRPAALEIAALIEKQFEAWNAGDLEAYLSVFWHSPLLIYVVDSSILNGFEQVRANVLREYGNRKDVGHPVLERLQTNMLSDDLATTISWWTFRFREVKVKGLSSFTWRKFPEGWRIIEAHTEVPPT
jgi:uncharacterized protein (TIGR02246 family)